MNEKYKYIIASLFVIFILSLPAPGTAQDLADYTAYPAFCDKCRSAQCPHGARSFRKHAISGIYRVCFWRLQQPSRQTAELPTA